MYVDAPEHVYVPAIRSSPDHGRCPLLDYPRSDGFRSGLFSSRPHSESPKTIAKAPTVDVGEDGDDLSVVVLLYRRGKEREVRDLKQRPGGQTGSARRPDKYSAETCHMMDSVPITCTCTFLSTMYAEVGQLTQSFQRDLCLPKEMDTMLKVSTLSSKNL